MISDEQLMADVRPELSTDEHIVRQIDGHIRLQRIMRQLPEHWNLDHLAPVGLGVLLVVFSRDPSAPVEGDFDYFVIEA